MTATIFNPLGSQASDGSLEAQNIFDEIGDEIDEVVNSRDFEQFFQDLDEVVPDFDDVEESLDEFDIGDLGLSDLFDDLNRLADDYEDEVIEGTNRNNQITGDSDPNLIIGLDGNDVLTGLGDQDVLSGGNGNDKLKGGEDNDFLTGDDGDDALQGDRGDDLLFGGNDRDTLIGGEGDDVLIGGNDRDNLVGGRGEDIFGLSEQVGRDIIRDFENGEDRLGLSNGLDFDDLDIIQRGNNTVIKSGSSQLAILRGVDANVITESDFV